jgi:hypothetical protein
MFIGTSINLPAKIRGITFELEMGSHTYDNLVNDYKQLGKENFEIFILDQIEVKEETDRELRAELETLEAIWVEKLKSDGVAFYNKK